jgi:hypothetical protein
MPAQYRSSRSSLAFLLLGLGAAALSAWPAGRGGASAPEAPSVEVRLDYPRGREALTAWLEREVVPGHTTLAEVTAVFGSRHRPLHRLHQGVSGIQYRLSDLGVRSWEDGLAFEFDADNRVVEHYFLTLGITGSH